MPNFEDRAERDADRAHDERNEFIGKLGTQAELFAEAANDYLAECDNGDVQMLARIACRAFTAKPGVDVMTSDERRGYCKLCERIADWAIDCNLDYAPLPARSAYELREDYEEARACAAEDAWERRRDDAMTGHRSAA